ncbi:MAG TPA: lysophospholipid acyltransferase family protein [Bacteroidia bacterium]|nr:lysophospholipid acyltransferase family protein [Bacteroidia bacterium]
MLSALLYYLVILPVSVLPFPVLHALSGILRFFLYDVFRYRRKVVMKNIRASFPDRSEVELHLVESRFYSQLCDTILEGFKMFSISRSQLQRRIKTINPEVIDKFYAAGKNVIIAVGHFNSWELLLTGFDSFIRHRAVVIYQPLTNSFFDKKIREARGRMGTKMLAAKNVKNFFSTQAGELTATVFAIDQSPSSPERCYWMNFLNQETPVLFGTEKYAKEFDLPVIYARLKKIRRGYYTLEFEEVTSEPQSTAYGTITEKATRMLEKDVLTAPESWLWSHRRWKHRKS